MKAYESLGVSAEDYLEAIFVLERQLGAVRSIDVARWLDVSKPSVCHAMKKLIAGGYLTMDVEHLLQLSEKGRDIAAAINERTASFVIISSPAVLIPFRRKRMRAAWSTR